MMPCSRCEQKGSVCMMDDSRSKKCSECVISGRLCDSSGVLLNSCKLSFVIIDPLLSSLKWIGSLENNVALKLWKSLLLITFIRFNRS